MRSSLFSIRPGALSCLGAALGKYGPREVFSAASVSVSCAAFAIGAHPSSFIAQIEATDRVFSYKGDYSSRQAALGGELHLSATSSSSWISRNYSVYGETRYKGEPVRCFVVLYEKEGMSPVGSAISDRETGKFSIASRSTNDREYFLLCYDLAGVFMPDIETGIRFAVHTEVYP